MALDMANVLGFDREVRDDGLEARFPGIWGADNAGEALGAESLFVLIPSE